MARKIGKVLLILLAVYVSLSVIGSLIVSFAPIEVGSWVLRHRMGLLITEISYAHVTHSYGDNAQGGTGHLGGYVGFTDREIDDRVLVVFVYEPWNLYEDAIWERYDVMVWS